MKQRFSAYTSQYCQCADANTITDTRESINYIDSCDNVFSCEEIQIDVLEIHIEEFFSHQVARHRSMFCRYGQKDIDLLEIILLKLVYVVLRSESLNGIFNCSQKLCSVHGKGKLFSFSFKCFSNWKSKKGEMTMHIWRVMNKEAFQSTLLLFIFLFFFSLEGALVGSGQ